MTDPVEPSVPDSTLIMPEGVYKVVKWIAMILLPAAGTLYFALGNIWDWPNVEQVIGTLTAIDIFLGVLLGISTSAYNKQKYVGDVVVTPTATGGKNFSLNLNGDPEELDKNTEVTFKVVQGIEPPENLIG